jgi:hypothetical protein
MNIIKIIESARKLSDKQVDLIKEVVTKGKYNTYSLLGNFLTLVAAGALYKCSIDTYNTDVLNSIAYAILGTHLVFKRYIISTLTALSFSFSTKRDLKECLEELNEIKEIVKN